MIAYKIVIKDGDIFRPYSEMGRALQPDGYQLNGEYVDSKGGFFFFPTDWHARRFVKYQVVRMSFVILECEVYDNVDLPEGCGNAKAEFYIAHANRPPAEQDWQSLHNIVWSNDLPADYWENWPEYTICYQRFVVIGEREC